MDDLDYWKVDESNVDFLTQSDLSGDSDYYDKRPCEYENRRYLFRIIDPEQHPEEGDLVYNFAFYVRDDKDPEFEDLEVWDKEWDENTVIVKWRHADSYDVEWYNISIDGTNKIVVPWRDATEIYDEIDWSAGGSDPFERCSLTMDGILTQCYYSAGGSDVLLEDDEVYYFVDNQEFAYIYADASDDSSITAEITAYDNDGNEFSDSGSGTPKDNLPAAPMLFYMLDPNEDQYGNYQSIGVTSADPMTNMDGTPQENQISMYRSYQYAYPGTKPMTYLSFSGSTVSQAGNTYASVPYLIIAEEPAITQNGVEVDLAQMSYTTCIVGKYCMAMGI